MGQYVPIGAAVMDCPIHSSVRKQAAISEVKEDILRQELKLDLFRKKSVVNIRLVLPEPAMTINNCFGGGYERL